MTAISTKAHGKMMSMQDKVNFTNMCMNLVMKIKNQCKSIQETS